MTITHIQINNQRIPVYTLDALVVCSGCAGFNAADWLHRLGRRDVAILTDGVRRGTSRNAGSDKQTYYKLSLGGDSPDSVPRMAADLVAGGGMHGDHALAMAACSARCFYRLADLGVPFPANEFGEYVGYQTDHDHSARATSAGPLTSKYMTEALERSANARGIPVLDHMMAVKLLTHDDRLTGVLALDLTQLDSPSFGLTLLRAGHVVLATGGPAGVYRRTVYPLSQNGMTGMALQAGCAAENLMDWQYGMASVKFRWNVSGTYQQVIPRYVSMGADGAPREFLPPGLLDMVFRKGYEWPYDPAKREGSSRIDLLVHREIHEQGRRVFLDYRSDPTGLDFCKLSGEARDYLARSGALLPTPIARLEKMNPRAVELYLNHGIDLHREPLEIDVCAQHCNGGIAVDAHWHSSLHGLYAAGEVAGTFGAYRPGGSALNAAQVGSMRAAQHIARQSVTRGESDPLPETAQMLSQIQGALGRVGQSPAALMARCQGEFSAHCAHARDSKSLGPLYQERLALLSSFFESISIESPAQIPALFLAHDVLLTQAAILSAMLVPGQGGVVRTQYQGGQFSSNRVPVRPIPDRNTWFETVWEEFTQ